MSLTHTNTDSVITSQDPVTPPRCYDSVHLLISLERASFFNQDLGLNGWPWARNALERLGEIGFSVVRCLQRFPETTFIQPHRRWSRRWSLPSGAHGFPFKFFLASCTSSDASCLPSPQWQLQFLLWVPLTLACSLQSPMDGSVQQGAFSALCSQGTFFRSVLTFLFIPPTGSSFPWAPGTSHKSFLHLNGPSLDSGFEPIFQLSPHHGLDHKWLRMTQKRLLIPLHNTWGKLLPSIGRKQQRDNSCKPLPLQMLTHTKDKSIETGEEGFTPGPLSSGKSLSYLQSNHTSHWRPGWI